MGVYKIKNLKVSEYTDKLFVTEYDKEGYILRSYWIEREDLCPLIEIDEPKVGRWKPHPTEPEWDICTVCGIGTHRRQITMDFVEEENYQYCPHCGARMRGE